MSDPQRRIIDLRIYIKPASELGAYHRIHFPLAKKEGIHYMIRPEPSDEFLSVAQW